MVSIPSAEAHRPCLIHPRFLVGTLHLDVILREALHHLPFTGMLKEHLRLLPDMCLVKGSPLSVRQVKQLLTAGMFSSWIDHIINLQRLRTGTLRITENMQLRHIQALDKLPSLLKIGIGLNPGAHDYIHTNKSMGHDRLHLLNLMTEQGRIIPATHQLQHRIATALQGYMKMGCKPTTMSHEINRLIGQQVWLNG